MISRLFALVALVGLATIMLPFVTDVAPTTALSPVAEGYVSRTPEELGAQNVVTAVIVTYRGLDTLGEVTVLFIATAGIGFLLRRSMSLPRSLSAVPVDDAGSDSAERGPAGSEPSEILSSGARILVPVVLVFGVYIFLHGHLTPGGGFQGGVLIAAAALLHFLSTRHAEIGHGVLTFVESLSGAAYVGIGILGIVLAAGFLDARLLPLGEYGNLVSAGVIPVIYSLVGLKVGAELTGILDRMRNLSETAAAKSTEEVA